MKISARWSITDDDLMSFEQSAAAVECMAKELDNAVVWAVLKESGWLQIHLEARRNYDHVLLKAWCDKNCQGLWRYCFSGNFLFESEKDAAWFVLRCL